ncbi:glycosyltransferase family 1 protein [Rossellomorea aquimaris]|uniref:glycosyltransferase family 4 protein n=1 Tax=Rossellomorea aquimaris TaxID=189382 RepID=UPI001CD1D451|nr:glycosyltransferase family 1 protein [Rossellomorea aquimaris]MCA1055748.1 glycosyltransferase family 1 protein [Rossellomorea aquimaris]
MRIALFSDTYHPQVNGVARTLKRLTDFFEKVGIEYKVFVPETQDKKEQYPNVHSFTSVPFFLYPECRTAIANPAAIERQLKEFAPTMIHVTTPLTMGLIGIRCAKKLNIPLVASYHTHFDYYLTYYKMAWLSPLLWKYMRWFHASAERIFVPSMDTKLHLESKGFKQLSIWSRGVDCEAYCPGKRSDERREAYKLGDKFTMLYVGRIAPEKDLDTLIKTIKFLPASVKRKVRWVIVGDGPMMKDVQKELKGENVTFTGYLNGEELAEVYASSDLFVFPSASETFGNVVLEAFASGLPAVVANKGGVTTIVEDGKDGKIAAAHDSQSFIDSITEIVENEALHRNMSQQARLKAEHLSWERIFHRLLSEYREVQSQYAEELTNQNQKVSSL